MSDPSTERLIAALAAQAGPVRPLAPPPRRALASLAVLLLAGAALVAVAGDPEGLVARYAGRETLMLAETAAMLLTGLLALLAAFHLAIPGAARAWLLAPLPPFALWIGSSGLGCYRDLVRLGPAGWGWSWGHGGDCLMFILAASLLVGAPLLWLLSRARPIDPLPVAVAGGLGAAALSALLLQFFHPFALTVVDLAVHLFAILLVVLIAALSRRRTLSPA